MHPDPAEGLSRSRGGATQGPGPQGDMTRTPSHGFPRMAPGTRGDTVPGMRIRTTLIAVAALLCGMAAPAQAIIGGGDAPEPYSFLGSLQRPGSNLPSGHFCGVSLLAPQWAITASHCLWSEGDVLEGTPRDWRVRFGSLDPTSGGQLVEVDRYHRYSLEPAEGDIALLHLKSAVHGQPVTMPPADSPVGTPARIVGWGQYRLSPCKDFTDPACYPDRLQQAGVEILPTKSCRITVRENAICVGTPKNEIQVGNSDSGGPALVRDGDRWLIAGVASHGLPDAPLVFTQPRHFASWMKGIMTGL
ncbi:serine protease [Pseudonocardiaceae bacterium YIM PH 21723]|nr:serine protease [Pseudonocardiaceae bacterium YIM PH 21723]